MSKKYCTCGVDLVGPAAKNDRHAECQLMDRGLLQHIDLLGRLKQTKKRSLSSAAGPFGVMTACLNLIDHS